MSNNLTINHASNSQNAWRKLSVPGDIKVQTNHQFEAELKKFDKEGANALSFSELKYLRDAFSSLGYNNVDALEAREIAHTMRKIAF